MGRDPRLELRERAVGQPCGPGGSVLAEASALARLSRHIPGLEGRAGVRSRGCRPWGAPPVARGGVGEPAESRLATLLRGAGRRAQGPSTRRWPGALGPPGDERGSARLVRGNAGLWPEGPVLPSTG